MESLGVLALAAGGVLIGARFSRLPKPWWMLGYFIPLLAVVLYAVALHFPALSFVPPVSWMMAGRNKFAVTGFMGAVLLTTPMLKMPRRRERIVVSVLMVCLVLGTSVWPFLAPAFNQSYFASLPTFVDEDGVCRQSTTYTCGPASAVTALRKLGFPAEEGQIAILAHTSSSIGTPPDILAQILNEKYGAARLDCQYKLFKSADELKTNGLTLAVIKYNLIYDHYVTVLEVTDKFVTVGDPLEGMTRLVRVDFENKWRYAGVVLKRKPSAALAATSDVTGR